MAVANHLAGFVESVTLVTGLGEGDNHEHFIRSKLKENVIPQFHYFKNAPTIVKARFVDGDLNKLFASEILKKEPPNLKRITGSTKRESLKIPT